MTATNPIISFYSRAIGEMKAKPITDPLSWRYQAAIHQYNQGEDPDPRAGPGETLPADRGTFWNECAHGDLFFLPWHRMYLHHFERMVMDHVTRLGGPADWALPYWNYSESAAAALLPEPFRGPTMPDGSTNHLHIPAPGRDPRANAGQPFASSAQSDKSACLGETAFARFTNVAENIPHGQMHVAVSGPSARGFMGSFTRAPLDPIFWLHHCNIDRLWQEWLRSGGGRANPTTSSWTSESFPFHDSTGAAGSMTPSQVVNSRSTPLLYKYDDEP